MTERQADMAGDNRGAETQEKLQAQKDLGRKQAAQEQAQMSGVDWERAIAERNEGLLPLSSRWPMQQRVWSPQS